MEQQPHRPLRRLSPPEAAFTLANEAAPLSVVCVLHLEEGPPIETLTAALVQLQQRHPLLRAGIHRYRGRYFFHQLDPAPALPLMVSTRTDEGTWKTITELALNTTFAIAGPLMKCWYVVDDQPKKVELIVCFHHAIIDGGAARLLLHELLSLAGGVPLSAPAPQGAFVTPVFPWGNFWGFLGRQIKEEWVYRRAGAVAPIPVSSHNAVIGLRLTPALSQRLTVRIAREGLHLNTVLLAAMTQAVLRHRYAGTASRLARVISFADLRSAFSPAVPEYEMGCLAAMLRFSIPFTPQQTIWEMAVHIRKALFQASRRNEIWVMARLSKHLVAMALRLKKARLGTAALSFIGKLDLESRYGNIHLQNVQAFITNNQYGPELSGFGKILFGAIGIDFTYLTAETTADQAQRIVDDIQETLAMLAELP